VMECGGNGRSFFQPQARGNQWTNGGAGCAEWTGVALADVLKAFQQGRIAMNLNWTFQLAGAKDEEIWAIAAFLKKLPTVSEADYKAWTSPPALPAAPAAAPPPASPPAAEPAPNPPATNQ